MTSHQNDNIDDEDLTVHACCAPLESFTRPVNVSEIRCGYRGIPSPRAIDTHAFTAKTSEDPSFTGRILDLCWLRMRAVMQEITAQMREVRI